MANSPWRTPWRLGRMVLVKDRESVMDNIANEDGTADIPFLGSRLFIS